MSGVTCIECGQFARVVGGKVIYPHRRDLYAKKFWLCDCGAYCGCHPGTANALGNPCGPETRKARSAAHAAFDPIWQRGDMPRKAAYKWLAEAANIPVERCHMGMMTSAEAMRVVAAVAARNQEQVA